MNSTNLSARTLTVRHATIWLLIWWTAGAFHAQSQTLRDALVRNNIDVRGLSAFELDNEITSYGIENAEDLFIIGYYRFGADRNAMEDSVHLLVFDKHDARWRSKNIPREQPSTVQGIGSWELGSVLQVSHNSRYIYLDTHLSPSAGIILVLTRDLQPVTTLFGWVEILLPNGIMLYHRGMVHFAPTHPAELWVFDERTMRDTALYPRKPYEPIRRAYIDTVRSIYAELGARWFADNNHHMDPEQFDCSLVDPFVTSGNGNAIAFVARFGEKDAPVPATPYLEVIVTITGIGSTQPRIVEQRLSDLQRLHPDGTIEQHLRDALQRRE